jgi:hypothetical protein
MVSLGGSRRRRQRPRQEVGRRVGEVGEVAGEGHRLAVLHVGVMADLTEKQGINGRM